MLGQTGALSTTRAPRAAPVCLATPPTRPGRSDLAIAIRVLHSKLGGLRNSTMASFKRILLVEDSAQDVELTLAALGENHLANDVVVVRDGVEALDYLLRRDSYASRPDGQPVVVLLDLKMPKVDGLEVLREMKSHPELKQIPVVMMTSSREEQDLVRSYALGVNAYVVKPVDFEQFVNSIQQLGFFWAVVNEPPPGSVRPS
jgi:CheY-like chemotaxis protein